jgi:hypothetical protein
VVVGDAPNVKRVPGVFPFPVPFDGSGKGASEHKIQKTGLLLLVLCVQLLTEPLHGGVFGELSPSWENLRRRGPCKTIKGALLGALAMKNEVNFLADG